MQERVRHSLGVVCKQLSELFTPTFGFPADLSFGGAGAEGVSNAFARSDHAHAVPEVPTETLENFDEFVVFVDDLMYIGISSAIPYNFLGAGSVGGQDVAGDQGAFGSLTATSGTTLGADRAIILQNSPSGVLTGQIHEVRRVVRQEMRVRIAHTSSELANTKGFVGALRASSNTFDIASFVDALGFYVDTNASGAGTWQAVAINNSSSTIRSTSVAATTNYHIFRVDIDGGEATFYIDGAQVAKIDENVPDVGRKVAGWVAGGENEVSGITRSTSVDYFLIKAKRVL